MLWEHEPQASVSTATVCFSNFHECFYNSIEPRSTCLLFLLENGEKLISALPCRVTPNMQNKMYKCNITDFQVTPLHCYTSVKIPNIYGTFQLLLICSFVSIINKLIASLLSFNLLFFFHRMKRTQTCQSYHA